MNRRQFIQHLGLASATTLVATGTSAWAARGSAQGSGAQRLIVIFLRGAVDGLSVVVPYREATYYEGRPKIAIPQPNQAAGVIDLDGQFGLHPALASLKPLWQQKSLAFVHASGSLDATRSHFEAQFKMESGAPSNRSDGWMNRLLGVMSDRNPIQAVNLGDVTPQILMGQAPVATLALGGGSARAMPLDRPMVSAAFDRLYSGQSVLSQTYREGRLAREALLAALEDEATMANNGAPLPNGFAKNAQRLGHIMAKDTRATLGFMALGGWDTHVSQGASQGILARNLEQLGLGLTALQQALGKTYASTTILVMSEFGRTILENSNGGTDHGHGNVMWVMGGSVRGGKVYGDWPGLSKGQLYEGRDLAITTDFKDVVATILGRHLRLPDLKLAQVLPQYKPLNQNLPLY